jgi:hypothetical protein
MMNALRCGPGRVAALLKVGVVIRHRVDLFTPELKTGYPLTKPRADVTTTIRGRLPTWAIGMWSASVFVAPGRGRRTVCSANEYY